MHELEKLGSPFLCSVLCQQRVESLTPTSNHSLFSLMCHRQSRDRISCNSFTSFLSSIVFSLLPLSFVKSIDLLSLSCDRTSDNFTRLFIFFVAPSGPGKLLFHHKPHHFINFEAQSKKRRPGNNVWHHPTHTKDTNHCERCNEGCSLETAARN